MGPRTTFQHDIGDPDLWIGPREAREAAFRELRDHDAVQRTADRSFLAADAPEQYWSLVRHDEVWAASRNPRAFASGQGTNITDDPPEVADLFGSMINLDDPRHFRVRSVVSSAFTPRHLEHAERGIRTRAAALVRDAVDRGGEFDFVEAIAAPLPLGVICDMMGIPSQDEPAVLRWTNLILGAGDPSYGIGPDELIDAATAMFDYAQSLATELATSPGDDLTSVIMTSDVDGDRLTPEEFGAFFILLVAAGNETTRTALSHGLLALTNHPDQRRAWFDDFDAVAKTAVEEIVRWATPVIHFRRTATEDVTIRGADIAAGDKVVLWYCSANRDERVWPGADRFDVRRSIQPTHVGFGGGGPHFCLGANLARREITTVFDEIRRQAPGLVAVGEPEWLQSNFINGIKHLPCAFGPA